MIPTANKRPWSQFGSIDPRAFSKKGRDDNQNKKEDSVVILKIDANEINNKLGKYDPVLRAVLIVLLLINIIFK